MTLQANRGAARPLRLGVNVDHVATLRNARGGTHPDPVRAAQMAIVAGADGITAHLREDRRHITDLDVERLLQSIDRPLNLEMAATDEMLVIALQRRPHAVCLVPEKRTERTTEGGLDAAAAHNHLAPYVRALGDAGIRVSLFIAAEQSQLEAARSLGAPVVELHCGAYADAAAGAARAAELQRLQQGAALAETLGLECHAGHGLDFDNVVDVSAITTLAELNIGHFLVGEALFEGFETTIRRMRHAMDTGRALGAARAQDRRSA
jgi:pyridoxine 5-phosphate synthase